ncbi:hypothetical protein KTO58_16945 [Chitinophaga pendula]|uniref:hypothetical protein n=1 Tax=Chitinophaga TaxID=79328 RepID=UPI000BAECFE4|nr:MULTISPECIES: hypothetical protein [Chitinophaga]ASZ11613.1 hypothetical protein CK934_11900 [Chitinophaga sp. MD30]UCJ05377.1 hypothetical protein KTO58_16945 [Chitinophaga pendula]
MKTLKLGVALIALAVGFATSAFTTAPLEYVWFDAPTLSFQVYGTEALANAQITPAKKGLIAYGYFAQRNTQSTNPFTSIVFAPASTVVLSAQLLKNGTQLTGNSLLIDQELYRQP